MHTQLRNDYKEGIMKRNGIIRMIFNNNKSILMIEICVRTEMGVVLHRMRVYWRNGCQQGPQANLQPLQLKSVVPFSVCDAQLFTFCHPTQLLFHCLFMSVYLCTVCLGWPCIYIHPVIVFLLLSSYMLVFFTKHSKGMDG